MRLRLSSKVAPLRWMGVRRDIMTSVCDSAFSALPRLLELFPLSRSILRANLSAGVKRMIPRRMGFFCTRPARCEISQIVNCHHEKAKLMEGMEVLVRSPATSFAGSWEGPGRVAQE